MSAANLKLGEEPVHAVVNLTLADLARGWGEGWMYPTRWQRWQRWNPKSDPEEWITGVLERMLIMPLVVHQVSNRETGATEYQIVDGQNRTNAAWRFLVDGSLAVTAGAVLARAPEPAQRMRFADFSPDQQRRIQRIEVPVYVYPPGTTEDELRRVFRLLNKGRVVTSHEVIHSWDHIALVRDAINVANERTVARVRAIQAKWKPQHLRMIHTWVRVAATVFDELLHFGTDVDRLERWVAKREGAAPLTAIQRGHYFAVIDRTLCVLEAWRRHGVVPTLAAVPDIAWAFHAFGCTDAVRTALSGPALYTIKTVVGAEEWWKHRGDGFTMDTVCTRREMLADVLAAELGVARPAEVARAWDEAPHGAVHEPPPVEADLAAAHALMDLMDDPPPPELDAADQAYLERMLAE